MERQLYLQNGIPCHRGKNVSRFFHCETWQKLWLLRKTKWYRIKFTIWAYILLAHDKNWSFPSLYHIYFIIQFINNPQCWNNVRTTLSLQRCKIQRWINVETSTLKSLTLKQRWSLVDQRNNHISTLLQRWSARWDTLGNDICAIWQNQLVYLH